MKKIIKKVSIVIDRFYIHTKLIYKKYFYNLQK